MVFNNHNVQITHIADHWEVYVDGKFFCSADSYSEAIDELYETYK